MARNGHAGIGHNSKSTLWTRRSYNIVDRDPECERFLAMHRKERVKDSDLAVMAGLATPTVKRMMSGETIAPRHSTFAKIAGAYGFRYELTRDVKPDYSKEIPKAREEYKAYKIAQAKKRERARA